MRRACLVACARTKREHPAPAADLYISPLFQKARVFAEDSFDRWYILSAKHGLLEPTEVIPPYDETLKRMTVRQRNAWAHAVFAKIAEKVVLPADLTVVGGNVYRAQLVPLLQRAGYRVDVPLAGLSIGRQLQWLNARTRAAQRLEHIERFYALLGRLESGVGKRILKECTARTRWPSSGVYLFFEPGEVRRSVTQLRIVRVGTHNVSRGAASTLWGRLRTHRGAVGTGSHRSSVFRLHVGAAIQAKLGTIVPTWGIGNTADTETRRREADIEREVSLHIGNMPLLWLAVNDPPSPWSDRAYLERNIIGLVAGAGRPIDPPSPSWLGRYSSRDPIRKSGLWNLNHLDYEYDPEFLEVLGQYVDITLGRSPDTQRPLGPREWFASSARAQLSLPLESDDA